MCCGQALCRMQACMRLCGSPAVGGMLWAVPTLLVACPQCRHHHSSSSTPCHPSSSCLQTLQTAPRIGACHQQHHSSSSAMNPSTSQSWGVEAVLHHQPAMRSLQQWRSQVPCCSCSLRVHLLGSKSSLTHHSMRSSRCKCCTLSAPMHHSIRPSSCQRHTLLASSLCPGPPSCRLAIQQELGTQAHHSRSTTHLS
jgi:hypothetical protein